MYFFISLIPATIWAVLGYFVLFSSTKTQGAVQRFGYYLAIWIFIIAAFSMVAGAYLTFEAPAIETVMKSMHQGVRP
jgi:hypothetical protein